MRVWTWVARRWPGSPVTTAISLPSCGSYRRGLVTSVLRVELFFDEEAGNWHYRVPALHINGGGTLTLDVNVAPAA